MIGLLIASQGEILEWVLGSLACLLLIHIELCKR